jgi:hypothetical protein
MPKRIQITIENKLRIEERDMNVYHHAGRSSHMISHNSSITLPLRPVTENDYLYISLIRGPGHIKNICVVDIPSWINFEFLSSVDNIMITRFRNRTLVTIPPGLPGWEIKLTRSFSLFEWWRARVTISETLQKK